MEKHTRIYIQALGLDIGEPIYSELSGAVASDIHHINSRGMGGTADPKKNSIFNLMALTREEHEKYGDKKQYMDFLISAHMKFLVKRAAEITKTTTNKRFMLLYYIENDGDPGVQLYCNNEFLA